MRGEPGKGASESSTELEAPSTEPSMPWYRRIQVSWIALGLGLVPFVVGAIVLATVGGDLHPIQDIAQMEMRTRDVGRYEVLLGPYSRDGWYHPGPAIFYLLAVPYRLTGGASVGLYLGALAINAGAVAGMALIARRRGGVALMLVTLLASGLLARSLEADFVRDPWNPSVTVLPFGLMLFLAWAMTCRELWALPAGVAVASFLAQTHIGYVALALPLLAWGAAWMVVPAVASTRFWRRASAVETKHAPPEADLRRVGWTVAASAGLLVLLWAPPVVEQLTGDSGNFGAIVDYFRANEEPAHSLTDGWRVMSTQFSATPDWVTGAESTSLSGEPAALYGGLVVPVMLVPLGLATAFLWQRGGESRRLLLTLAVALVLAFVAVARTTGIAFTYRLHWVQVLGMATGVVMAWAAWLAIQPRLSPRALRQAAGAALAMLAVIAVVNVAGASRAGTPLERESGAVAALMPEVLAGLPADGDPSDGDSDGVFLVNPTSFGSLLYTTGITLALARSGVDARMPGLSEAAGAHRTLGDTPPTATLVVVVNEDVSRYMDDPSLELLASWGTPPEPRPADDPVVAAEEAFAAKDTNTMKELGRQHLDDDLPELFDIVAVAVLLQR